MAFLEILKPADALWKPVDALWKPVDACQWKPVKVLWKSFEAPRKSFEAHGNPWMRQMRRIRKMHAGWHPNNSNPKNSCSSQIRKLGQINGNAKISWMFMNCGACVRMKVRLQSDRKTHRALSDGQIRLAKNSLP